MMDLCFFSFMFHVWRTCASLFPHTVIAARFIRVYRNKSQFLLRLLYQLIALLLLTVDSFAGVLKSAVLQCRRCAASPALTEYWTVFIPSAPSGLLNKLCSSADTSSLQSCSPREKLINVRISSDQETTETLQPRMDVTNSTVTKGEIHPVERNGPKQQKNNECCEWHHTQLELKLPVKPTRTSSPPVWLTQLRHKCVRSCSVRFLSVDGAPVVQDWTLYC